MVEVVAQEDPQETDPLTEQYQTYLENLFSPTLFVLILFFLDFER
jgi:hypothetical protein